MDDILLLEAIERYLRGEMPPEEKAYFEDLRKRTPEIDLMVVEHQMFLNQIQAFGEQKAFKHSIHLAHLKLVDQGKIFDNNSTSTKGKIVAMWQRYKKITAIAASIAGITTLFIAAIVAYFSPVANVNQIEQLNRDIQQIKQNQQYQGKLINEVKSKVPENAELKAGGTGFLIDTKGFMITNAHVVKGSSKTVVINNKGQEFNADIIAMDVELDLALLRINDKDFKTPTRIPYSIKKHNSDLGEEIYTLGYPRNEIVYNMGYLSAKTGYNGDTMTCQIQMSANPGNSGGPVLNNNGEIVGVISTRQTQAEGVSFAIRSKNIYKFLETLKDKSLLSETIKLNNNSMIRNKARVDQVKQTEDFVYLVKAFNN